MPWPLSQWVVVLIERAVKAVLRDPSLFSRKILRRPLRPYQLEPAGAILDSILGRKGYTISVEMARQGGKNELSAQLECYLLNLFQRVGGNIVKAAPTFKPQVIVSRQRLEEMLQNPWNQGRARSLLGYIVRLGNAQVVFFSADQQASVVGATAHIALEFDEAQDISTEKHDKEFVPMGATTNCTRVYYGTAWDDTTLLERVKQENLELERKDGVKRHFQYPWWVVAEHNPLYSRYVEGEKARLGESHPLFRTQYKLETIGGTSGFLSVQQREQIRGDHPRGHRARLGERAEEGATYVAGVDLAGEDEEAEDAALRALRPRRDSTVVTVARLELDLAIAGVVEPRLRVVDHYYWTGRGHRQQYETLLDVLRNVWRCSRVVVDASGVGAGVASFLVAAMGETVVTPFVFTSPSKSSLAYQFLAAVNSGRFKMYADDGSEEYREFWRECELAQYTVRANQQLNFYVRESEGHDDFLVSAALCVAAAEGYGIAPAAAVIPPVEEADEREF